MAINDVYTPRLDRFAAMQDRPLGTNTALYRDPAREEMNRNYRREQSDFNMARRLLRREVRRGGATGMAAADRLLNMAPMAEERGVQFGGVQRAGAREAAVGGRMESRRQEAEDMDLGRQAGRKAMQDFIGGRSATPRLDAGVQTPGLDSNPVRTSRPSWATSPDEANAARDYVSELQRGHQASLGMRRNRERAGELIRNYENASTIEERSNAYDAAWSEGMAMGGTEESIEAALTAARDRRDAAADRRNFMEGNAPQAGLNYNDNTNTYLGNVKQNYGAARAERNIKEVGLPYAIASYQQRSAAEKRGSDALTEGRKTRQKYDPYLR